MSCVAETAQKTETDSRQQLQLQGSKKVTLTSRAGFEPTRQTSTDRA